MSESITSNTDDFSEEGSFQSQSQSLYREEVRYLNRWHWTFQIWLTLLAPSLPVIHMGKLSSLFLDGNGKKKGMANPMNSMKRRNDRILKEELPRSVSAQYATRDQWRDNSRKNEGMEPKQKQYPVVDRTGDRSKVWCYKEQYCIGTWNVRSMNQGNMGICCQIWSCWD